MGKGREGVRRGEGGERGEGVPSFGVVEGGYEDGYKLGMVLFLNNFLLQPSVSN